MFHLKNKNLVIVGNGESAKLNELSLVCENDLSEFIDESDLVIRINIAKNHGGLHGSKTDVLALVNVGSPAVEFSSVYSIKSNVKSETREIWFTRPKGFRIRKSIFSYKSDVSNEILRFQGINDILTKYIDSELYDRLLDSVNLGRSGSVLFEPSSGLCVIGMALSDSRFIDYKKYIVGFTWEGWHGYNWLREIELCQRYADLGEITIL